MANPKTGNPADLVKHYVELIVAEREKLEEALAAITEYSEALRRVTEDTGRRLIARQ